MTYLQRAHHPRGAPAHVPRLHPAPLLPRGQAAGRCVDTHMIILWIFICIDSFLGSVLQIYLSLTQNHFRLH